MAVASTTFIATVLFTKFYSSLAITNSDTSSDEEVDRNTSRARYEAAAITSSFGDLKTTPRTGWLNNNIPPEHCESVADHSWRMSLMVLLYDPLQNKHNTPLDVARMCMMCVVHDLAEAITGDITPPSSSGISRTDKQQREEAAMTTILTSLGPKSPSAATLHSIWQEYEHQSTPEAQFVKDVDRLEMLSQAVRYEKKFPHLHLQTFFDSTLNKARSPQTKQWDAEIRLLRNNNDAS